jgi:hypothetical protein
VLMVRGTVLRCAAKADTPAGPRAAGKPAARSIVSVPLAPPQLQPLGAGSSRRLGLVTSGFCTRYQSPSAPCACKKPFSRVSTPIRASVPSLSLPLFAVPWRAQRCECQASHARARRSMSLVFRPCSPRPGGVARKALLLRKRSHAPHTLPCPLCPLSTPRLRWCSDTCLGSFVSCRPCSMLRVSPCLDQPPHAFSSYHPFTCLLLSSSSSTSTFDFRLFAVRSLSSFTLAFLPCRPCVHPSTAKTRWSGPAWQAWAPADSAATWAPWARA